MPLFVVETTNIKALSNSQIDLLRCGDYLVKKTGDQEHSYKVVYKKDDEMSLVYCDYHNVEEVYYEKNASGWHYISTENHNLDDMPTNGQVVHKMTAPSSTTLTDEEIAKIVDGVFIEGTFLGATNPVLCPASIYNNDYYGFIIAQMGIYGNTRVTHYRIKADTKVISLYENNGFGFGYAGVVSSMNGKSIPAYPSDTGTFTLKMVNGVLTWVSD